VKIKLEQDGVEINLDGPYVEYDSPTSRAMEDCMQLVRHLDDLKGFAADKLLKLYNDDWVDERIGKLDRASFMARLAKPSIDMDELGAAAVYFEDGGLFAGHWIEVLTKNAVPTNAGIIG
jgi:hypothetical protein